MGNLKDMLSSTLPIAVSLFLVGSFVVLIQVARLLSAWRRKIIMQRQVLLFENIYRGGILPIEKVKELHSYLKQCKWDVNPNPFL